MKLRTQADWSAQANSSQQIVYAVAQEFAGLAESLGALASRDASSNWVRFAPLFRLLLSGEGTCAVDSMNALGEITASVETYSSTEGDSEIVYPYAGDEAVYVRFILTGTCTAEIL